MTPNQLLAEVLKVDRIGIRPACPDDLGYIVDSFFRSYRAEQPDMRTKAYAKWVREHLRRLMTQEGSEILVAHADGEPDALRGWVAFGPNGRLDFVYVAPEVRGFGLARRLVTSAGIGGDYTIAVTHLTEAGRKYKATHAIDYVPLP